MLEQEKLEPRSRPGGMEVGGKNLVKLEKMLYEKHQLSLFSYRPNYIKRRLNARIRSLRLDSLSQYLEFLEGHPEEGERFIDSLTISVTNFFRDEDTFRVLSKKAAPELINFSRENKTEIRAWSAGCCTGEEAYSLAMMFLELEPDLVDKTGLRIWATDIDQSAIKFSQDGIYPKVRLDNLHPGLIRRYFQRHREGYQIRPLVRKLITFRRENLLVSGPSGFEGMDLIMCRNLLIYLEREEQIRLLANFDRSLRQGGYLVLGKTEFMFEPYRSKYQPISVPERIYQKPFGAMALEQAGGEG